MAHEEDIPVQMNILKAIFSDHWSIFLKENEDKMRPVIIEEVEKFLHCGELSNGFLTFKCKACPKVKKIPIRCKGKFCPTCADIQANDMYRSNDRHVVFTIDEGLRSIFARKYRFSWSEREKEIRERERRIRLSEL